MINIVVQYCLCIAFPDDRVSSCLDCETTTKDECESVGVMTECPDASEVRRRILHHQHGIILPNYYYYYYYYFYYCQREAYRLHADIVMSLEDIFGYISSKAGRIWTKLGRGMGSGERVLL